MIQSPYLRTTRGFPANIPQLSLEINRAYVDIANAVNNRTIGLFTTSKPTSNGESWFFDRNKKQQGSRKIYYFTSMASIPHGLTLSLISNFTRCYGMYTDGTNWYGIISGSNIAIDGQISFYINSTDIVLLSGVGAPVLSNGIVVLEWLSDV